MIDLQPIRGIYERIAIDATGIVPVYVENQATLDFSAIDEFCCFYVNFGEMQEGVIGARPQWHVRGSLVCEIYTRKNIGAGRGLQIASPIIEALMALNGSTPPLEQQIIARVGPLTGPAQAQLRTGPHHFTRFSMPFSARSRP